MIEDQASPIKNLQRMHELKTGVQPGMHDVKMEIKADIKDLKIGVKELGNEMIILKTGFKESEMERKSFQYNILQKLDAVRTELTSVFTQS
jgi:hypothetical protein